MQHHRKKVSEACSIRAGRGMVLVQGRYLPDAQFCETGAIERRTQRLFMTAAAAAVNNRVEFGCTVWQYLAHRTKLRKYSVIRLEFG